MARLSDTAPESTQTPPAQRPVRAPGKAQVRPPSGPPDLALSRRQALQRQAVERFNHRTFRNDWEELMRELFVRVVDGCPFAVGMFTQDGSWGIARLKALLNFNGGKDAIVTYVRRHFKLRHFRHIAHSLAGLAPHERFDLYKIVSPGLGMPLNTLVYRIEHYTNPDLRAVILFGGERLGGQMEVHLKMTAGLLEQPMQIRSTERPNTPEASRYTKLIAALRAADPRQLRRSGLNPRRMAELQEIVTGLEGIHEQFPELLRAKFILLSRIVEDPPPPPQPPAGPAPPGAEASQAKG